MRALHDHKLGVIASCILGMDSHGKDYHQTLIKSLKESKADFPRIFLMTACGIFIKQIARWMPGRKLLYQVRLSV